MSKKPLTMYHLYMDTDIDKWDTIEFQEPKELTAIWWGYYSFEVTSVYDFIERYDGKLAQIEGIDTVLCHICEYFSNKVK